MKKKTSILLILTGFLFVNCNSYKPTFEVGGKTIKGKIIDGELEEALIGQSVQEYGRPANNTLTDTLGNFELKFLGNIPVIILTGFYEPLYIEINPGEFNHIVLDSKTSKKSKKTLNSISRSNKASISAALGLLAASTYFRRARSSRPILLRRRLFDPAQRHARSPLLSNQASTWVIMNFSDGNIYVGDITGLKVLKFKPKK